MLEQLKNKIKKLNIDKQNIPYYLALGFIILESLFLLITIIIQMDWLGYSEAIPCLAWMISAPYVGIFFLPFLIVVTTITIFILNNCKPATISGAKNYMRALSENEKITKDEYDKSYDILDIAQKRESDKKILEKEENSKLLESIAENEKENN